MNVLDARCRVSVDVVRLVDQSGSSDRKCAAVEIVVTDDAELDESRVVGSLRLLNVEVDYRRVISPLGDGDVNIFRTRNDLRWLYVCTQMID